MEFRDPRVYNPLDKGNLGISVRDALLGQSVTPMGPLLGNRKQLRESKFFGSGIYALYYVGDLPLYEPVSQGNRDGKFGSPIYVGKAVPKGSRKGGFVTCGFR